MLAKYRMELSFSKYLAINEIFCLDQGKVLSLSEALSFRGDEDETDPQAVVRDRIASVQANYVPGPRGSDHLTAAVLGFKPCAIIQYKHHPESPAAAIVAEKLKTGTSNAGAIQAELLKHGFKVRSDFAIVPIHLDKYMTTMILVGGKAACDEMKTLYMCQFHLDLISSPAAQADPDKMARVPDIVHGKCDNYCGTPGPGGEKCMPIHRRIGQLLGYTQEQVEEFLAGMKTSGGYDHMPDVKYPVDLPPSLASVPRRKGFTPNESRYKASNAVRVLR